MRFSRLATIWLCTLVFLLSAAASMRQNTEVSSMPVQRFAKISDEQDSKFDHQHKEQTPEEIQRQREMAKGRAAERYKKLKQDTDKLLELSTQLKQYVDKSNDDVLSLEIIRKAEEIEKLAKNVKNNMKGE